MFEDYFSIKTITYSLEIVDHNEPAKPEVIEHLAEVFEQGQHPERNAIANPRHSRRLNAHRTTTARALLDLAEMVWTVCCADLEKVGRSGPKPKAGFQDQLLAVLLDLYVAWLDDPELSLGLSMSVNDWKTGSRYNKLRLSRWVVELVRRLETAGFIDVAMGSYSGPAAKSNRTTRIRAAGPLRELFQDLPTSRVDVVQVAGQECIILKSGDAAEDRLQEYEDTPETNRMRQELEAYNALIADTFIDIPVLDDPWLLRADGRGGQIKVAIDQHHQSSRRIFSRGRWDHNGRFYGPWWQQISGADRRKIYINDTPTVEIDFKGLHLAILAKEAGIELQGDPYALPEGTVAGVSPEEQRKAVKALVLVALNAKSRKATFASFREGSGTGSSFKTMTNKELQSVLDVFIDLNPHLRDCLGSDQGIRLMNVDSKIAEKVLAHFTMQGIPVLCIHDSFIIDYTRSLELKHVMKVAAEEVVGTALRVEQKGVGWDEMLGNPSFVVLDFRFWAETARSSGYLKRLESWEEQSGKVTVPYRF